MIVVTIEEYPVGNFAKRRIVGSALILNDGTGTQEESNYRTRIYKDGETVGRPKITKFSRQKFDVWDLIGEVIKKRKEK